MKEIHLKAFNAISEFVNDLWEAYGDPTKVTPLALYRRLIQHIQFSHEEAIMRAIGPFQKFTKKYNDIIIEGDLSKIHRGEVINYGENPRVLIEVQKFIHKGDDQTKSIIHQHLLTISAILNPSEEALKELEKKMEAISLDDSPEGQFLNEILEKARSSVGDSDTDNPMAAMGSLLQSGVVQDLFSGLQSGIASGEMDFQKLLGSMQGALGSLMQGSSQGSLQCTSQGTSRSTTARIEEVKDEDGLKIEELD